MMSNDRFQDLVRNWLRRVLGNVIIKLADAAGGTRLEALDSDDVVVWSMDSDGNGTYIGDLTPYRNATSYTAYAFVPLTTPLTSVSWDDDSFSTTAKTLIDLSTVFSAPAGIKAINCKVAVRDSESAANPCYLILSPNNVAASGMNAHCERITNDVWVYHSLVVPCDSNGDVYYQIEASGDATLDALIEIWGYWI